MSKSPTTPAWEAVDVATDTLLLDPENPRLADYGISKTASQDEIVRVLWVNMAVDELALSIAENGFYRHGLSMLRKKVAKTTS